MVLYIDGSRWPVVAIVAAVTTALVPAENRPDTHKLRDPFDVAIEEKQASLIPIRSISQWNYY